MAGLTKKDIIESIIFAATERRFSRHKLVDDLPAVALEDFQNELIQFGEEQLRESLSALSRTELIGAMEEWADQLAVLQERSGSEATARERNLRQRELAQRPRLQPAILAAARHFRACGLNAGEAWDKIKDAQYRTDDDKTVVIEGSKDQRLNQEMRVVSRQGSTAKTPNQI